MSIRVELVGDDLIEVTTDEISEFVGFFSERLSREGVSLPASTPLPRGREVVAVLKLADGFVLVEGRAMVAWERRPWEGSNQQASAGLHFLELREGGDFVDRLVAEHVKTGGLAFSVERSAPVTADGSPPEAEALDQMMARRLDRSGTDEIEAFAPFEAGIEEDETHVPDFAPGFGKAQDWNKEVALPIPGEIKGWLGAEPGEPPEVQDQPQASPSASSEPERGDSGALEFSKEPDGGRGPGPIRMKMPTPSGREPKSSSSFLEASRKANELLDLSSATARARAAASKQGGASPSGAHQANKWLGDAKPGSAAGRERSMPTGSKPRSSSEDSSANNTLATVALKPDEIARMVEAGRLEHESGQMAKLTRPRISGAGARVDAEFERTAETSLRASDGIRAANDIDLPSGYQSQLDVDPELLGEDHDGFLPTATWWGEHKPTLVVGGIVIAILALLIFWMIGGQPS